MYSFEDARRKAAAVLRPEWPADAGTFIVMPYGWEDETHWKVLVGASECLVDGDFNYVQFDAPAILVSKASGKLERLHIIDNLGRLGRMQKVGEHPTY